MTLYVKGKGTFYLGMKIFNTKSTGIGSVQRSHLKIKCNTEEINLDFREVDSIKVTSLVDLGTKNFTQELYT